MVNSNYHISLTCQLIHKIHMATLFDLEVIDTYTDIAIEQQNKENVEMKCISKLVF